MTTYSVQIGFFKEKEELLSFRFEVRAAAFQPTGRKVVGSGRKLVEKPHRHRLGIDLFGWLMIGILAEQQKEILVQ